MKQSAFTVWTPLIPERLAALETLLAAIGDDIGANPHLRFADFTHLHYASLFVVAEGPEPYLVFEGNIDGEVEVFLAALLSQARDGLDAIYAHAVGYPPPSDPDVATRLRYLCRHDLGPGAFYVAWPGQSVSDIHREHHLRRHMEDVLDHGESTGLRQRAAGEVYRGVAESLPAGLGWARSPASVPFLVTHGRKVIAALVAPIVLGLLGVVRSATGRSGEPRRARRALVFLGATLAAGAWKLRREEAADGRADRRRELDWQAVYARWTETEDLGGIVATEDRKGQNHMVSVTQIKPGWFRLPVLEVVLWAINLLARLRFNRGSLGGITSIHFARWVITPDRRSLIFMSNFDGSWERYLNDFIDLAAIGLTAVWTNTDNAVGFPGTRWLLFDGARDEARFKAYARYSMVPTNVWYSAYPDISVTNIANNRAIRNGLASVPSGPVETAAWLRRL